MSEMYNLEELGQPFKLELDFGVLKAGMKENDTSSNELWKPPVAKLRPIQGFNVRVKNDAYWARVRRYADSLKKNGYMSHKPMSGYMGRDPVTGENVLFYTAGYTRMDAIALANSELPSEKQIKNVTMVVHSRDATPTQLNALLITENEAAPYNAFEASVVCKRMLDDGNSVAEIAALVNYTTVWVEALLKLAASPIELQRMVVDDVIKPTFAIEMIEAHGSKALAVLQEALARKTGSGEAAPAGSAAPAEGSDGDAEEGAEAQAPKKFRLTAKDLIKPEVRKFNNAMKKEAPAMYSTLSGLASHPAFDAFPPDTREQVLALVAKLKQLEVGAEAPAADPRQVALFQGDTATTPGAAGAAITTDPT